MVRAVRPGCESAAELVTNIAGHIVPASGRVAFAVPHVSHAGGCQEVAIVYCIHRMAGSYGVPAGGGGLSRRR